VNVELSPVARFGLAVLIIRAAIAVAFALVDDDEDQGDEHKPCRHCLTCTNDHTEK
jgi:hypothetical protein